MSEEKETRKPAAKKAPAKKPVAKKAAPKKTTATKAAATKKPAARKASAKPAAAAKTAAKKPAVKKPAVKKPAAAKPEPAEKRESASKPAEGPSSTGPSEANEQQSTHQANQDTGSGDTTYTFDADDIRREFKEKDWAAVALRGAFMLLFGFLAWIAISVNFLLAGLQFIMLVLTGGPNEFLRKVIMVLGRYIVDVMQFLSFESDQRPFPLGKDLPNTD